MKKSIYRIFSVNFNIDRKRETSVGVTRLFFTGNRVFPGRSFTVSDTTFTVVVYVRFSRGKKIELTTTL